MSRHNEPAASSFRLPAALKALLAQLAGWAIVIAALSQGLFSGGPWALVAIQSVSAAAAAWALRSDWWWLPIHLGFSPLLLAANALAIAPGWYLAAFAILALVFWTSFRSRVPLFLSNRAAVEAVRSLLPSDRHLHVLDIGSGTGTLLVPLARVRQDCRFTGVEAAPAPWLVSRIRARRKENLDFRRGDFFDISWSGYDVIYAFLSPEPMEAVWRKARREMSPDSLLVSNSFPVAGVVPDRILDLSGGRGARLYVYRPNAGVVTAN